MASLVRRFLAVGSIALAMLAALGWWLGAQADALAAPPEPVEPPAGVTTELTHHVYLPLVIAPAQAVTITELRAVWISRFDWTRRGYTPTVSDIQTLVDQAAQAGFNVILFQVRGAGDAYYTPGREPWASRLTGTYGETLGRDPGWDPLAAVIVRAHAAGLQVHAWLNVYPAWLPPPSEAYGPLLPPRGIVPPQALNRFTFSEFDGYGLGYTWRVYDSRGHMPVTWNQYTWASPAAPRVQDHIALVVADIVARYAVDGIHLDHVRYPGPQYSLDPFTLAAYAADPLSHTLTITDWRPDFQRAQVTQLVARLTAETHAARPTLTVSAAVWPVYKNMWGWPNTRQGYSDYYQDSQGWLASGALDAGAPMLYSSIVITDLNKWTLAAADFQAHAAGRQVWPGIGVRFNAGPLVGQCVPFEEIAARIRAARELGTAGHAIFSLGDLIVCGYLDDLAEGPYAVAASMPSSTNSAPPSMRGVITSPRINQPVNAAKTDSRLRMMAVCVGGVWR